ncbi:type I polyketide synthase [Pontibacter silvestris]|uniref:Type I polyketide synthase n=1 Tax=Pontibacter silvestris TaxID=2305183 RepID=A0ABW4X5X3_9BACT|nr:type I polyketide synthase [Pontibacter silvestris]MCC9138353.1 acyltransferase domain-containing protein [Pontibacter silvestris]
MNNHLSLQQTPVAIIGMSGLFAGSQNLEAFWENIVEQANCITEVPSSRWNIEDYYDPDPKKADKTYSKVGGFLPDIDFDPLEFGLPPNILEVTDSSQILSLIMAKQALEDAKYVGDRFTEQIRRNTGIILGVGGAQKLSGPLSSRLQYPIWRKVLSQYGLSDEAIEEVVEKMKTAYVSWQENAFPGFLGNVIAGRIANRFDLGGTNCVVDAACAASLSAIKMSIQELLEHRCDMMITGGVDTDNTPMAYMSFSKTPAFSKRNRSTPFDAEADGIVIGEGIGMLVMKRLADAERDGDTIYAVIKGIGSSSDGKNSSIYAPVSEGQQLAMQRAYNEAGYSPATVGLLEAHGTGTPTGDRVEFHSISSVFEGADAEQQKIALGSVKSQIGHTKTAAGAASLIKTTLALHHKVLPPTINVKKPNPAFGIESSPFYINTQLRPWIQSMSSTPRRASVSAFGFGGTNFHMTLEEYQPEHKNAYRNWSPYHSCVLYANDYESLKDKCLEVLNATQQSKAFKPLPVPVSVPQESPRLGFAYKNKTELLERLTISLQTLQQANPAKSWDHPKGISYSPQGMKPGSKIAVLFSGQGSQYLNMGRNLSCLYPEFRQNFQHADEIMHTMYGQTVSDKVYPVPAFDDATLQKQEQTLTQTQYAQPAIGVMSMSMYNMLMKAGFEPDMVGGHSFGELTALWASGVINEDDYLKLACLRGQVMAQAAKGEDAGGMLAVQADVETVKKVIREEQLSLDLSNINAPDQVVLGGSTDEVRGAVAIFDKYKINAKVLPVSAAFHTHRLKDAQRPLADAISSTEFKNPKYAIYSNMEGQAYPATGATIQQKFKEHMLSTVQFQKQIENMYEAGARVFVEVGPRNILSKLVQSTLQNSDYKAISINNHPKPDSAMLYQLALAQLLVAGVSLDAADQFKLEPDQLDTYKPKMKVQISASNYVSEKSKEQWEQALQESSDKVSAPNIKIEVVQLTEPAKQPTIATNGKATLADQKTVAASAPSEEVANTVHSKKHIIQKQLDLMEEMLKFHQQQQAALEQHRILLEAYKEQISQLFSEEHTNGHDVKEAVSPNTAAMPALPDALTSLTSNGNGHHTTNGHQMNGHSTKNGHQVSNGQQHQQKIVPEAKPIISEPVAVQPEMPVNSNAAISEAPILALIAEKTGYPAEMLSLDMELVSDLGIDSIKQVEIFGALREQYPVLEQYQTEALFQIKTISDIVDKVNQHFASPPQAVAAAEPSENIASPSVPEESLLKPVDHTSNIVDKQEASSPVTETVGQVLHKPAPTPPAPAPGLNADAVTEALLALIAEKTGYPAEMLSLDMELTADLGIDSIKQVEIMGAVREKYHTLSKMGPEQLIGLKTISDVIDLIMYGTEKKVLTTAL